MNVLMNNSDVLTALSIAIAPAIITSIIEGAGEWSNSRNFRKSESLKAIHSFRLNVENLINNPNTNYYVNIGNLNNSQLQQIVMFLNQWSVYITDHVASKKIIIRAIGFELLSCLLTLLPSAHRMSEDRNIDGYFRLLNEFNIKDTGWYNANI